MRKYLIGSGSILLLVVLISACSNPKQSEAGEEAIVAITGTVESIENGKDGYTAQIKTEEGEVYYATVSRVNLGENGNYRSLEIGEKVSLKGKYWVMDDKKQITVSELPM